ncbi:Xylose isomerase domain-containing protein TIM barrel [Thermaerobacter marianensis DSM 12885]|uniref:Xylose isomerase domain-containing protein TIM barrel n=1 Tax=Thermaerobacter marianensis (strain ATCC 700841 / DSM 12885 / JCM 10246 / 7p75a) TaxID=644966 RepID=E6SJJ8_THEM7|nr:sugar phosphate isomerase/epimerase [Thermaerobacter marianensis]ADU52153.1 Xylose isomerase domain-containing protein TIM barrel [Thermaerobacter marianensis DSM 12885]
MPGRPPAGGTGRPSRGHAQPAGQLDPPGGRSHPPGRRDATPPGPAAGLEEARPGSSASPVLALPCRSLWRHRHRPEDPRRFLAALPDEARRRRAEGAGALEFHADACLLDDRYADPAPWREAAVILEAEGLAATVHLPYVWPDLTALNAAVWEGSVTSIATALRAVAPLRPRLAAVHPANFATQALVLATPPGQRPALMDELASRLVRALRRLASGAPASAAEALALENLEGVAWPLFEAVCREAGVAVCFDVGHALSNGDDPVALARSLAGRIRGLHLHDAVPPPVAPAGAASQPAVGRAHLPLGAGRLPLDGLVAALRETGFAGPVVLEVDDDAGLAASAERFHRAWHGAGS